MPRLKLKWAFGLPGDVQSWAGITLAGGRLFFGSIAGNVYSLDARTGCVHWAFDAGAIVRTAVSVGPLGTTGRFGAFFGDARGNAYAVDAATGALVWKVAAETFPSARLTGSPILHEGRLYVPVSSSEEGVGSLTDYECCRFRGSVVALDAATGRQIWKTYTIPEEPRPVRKNAKGVQLWGPSGAPIWSSPVVDPVRRALYVTTGNNYSDPTTATSDAFMAMDLETGRILWTHQVTARDAYVSACRLDRQDQLPRGQGARTSTSPHRPSWCRSATAAAPWWRATNRATSTPSIRIARARGCGKRGSAKAVRWAACSGDRRPMPDHVYVALSDLGRIMLSYTQFTDADRTRGGGMFALRLTDGARVWHTPPRAVRRPAALQPCPVGRRERLPGVAFAGSLDGHLRAYAASTGAVVWDYDTVRNLRDGQWRACPGRVARRSGPGHRRRHGLRELRLHGGRRRPGQRGPGLCARLNLARLRFQICGLRLARDSV